MLLVKSDNRKSGATHISLVGAMNVIVPFSLNSLIVSMFSCYQSLLFPLLRLLFNALFSCSTTLLFSLWQKHAIFVVVLSNTNKGKGCTVSTTPLTLLHMFPISHWWKHTFNSHNTTCNMMTQLLLMTLLPLMMVFPLLPSLAKISSFWEALSPKYDFRPFSFFFLLLPQTLLDKCCRPRTNCSYLWGWIYGESLSPATEVWRRMLFWTWPRGVCHPVLFYQRCYSIDCKEVGDFDLECSTPASSLASVWRSDYFDATGEHISLLQGRDVSKVVMKYCQMTCNGLFVLLTYIYILWLLCIFLSLFGVALP